MEEIVDYELPLDDGSNSFVNCTKGVVVMIYYWSCNKTNMEIEYPCRGVNWGMYEE